MTTFLRLSTLLAFVITSSGCAVVLPTHHHHGKSRSALHSSSGKKKCHPSQYWDGAICRHKGKGKGARKHDG